MITETESSTTQCTRPDLTVLLLTWNEASNLALLLPRLHSTLETEQITYEILVIDANSQDNTADVAQRNRAKVYCQRRSGYGAALQEGIVLATGRHILTLDADLSHDPKEIPRLWNTRIDADVVIASRFVRGGTTLAPYARVLCSRLLNWGYARVLAIPIADMSSGFRLYRSFCVKNRFLSGTGFDILEELLAQIYLEGGKVVEIPFAYLPRGHGESKAKLVRFGFQIFITLMRIRINRSRFQVGLPRKIDANSDWLR